MADLADLARTTLANNRFMVLGTVDASGRPRVSPVWFALVDQEAAAARVPVEELAVACSEAFRNVAGELSYTPETLRDEPFVLYRARVVASEVHVRGRDFGDGSGPDQRVPVDL